MLNAEKFRKELLELSTQNIAFAVRKEEPSKVVRCDIIKKCTNCLFGRGRCSANSTKWLLEEYKERIKLTEFEYNILKHCFDRGWEYIARDKNGCINVYFSEPRKLEDFKIWRSNSQVRKLEIFNDLFRFIKWQDEESKVIKEILDNCEVIENDL